MSAGAGCSFSMGVAGAVRRGDPGLHNSYMFFTVPWTAALQPGSQCAT